MKCPRLPTPPTLIYANGHADPGDEYQDEIQILEGIIKEMQEKFDRGPRVYDRPETVAEFTARRLHHERICRGMIKFCVHQILAIRWEQANPVVKRN